MTQIFQKVLHWLIRGSAKPTDRNEILERGPPFPPCVYLVVSFMNHLTFFAHNKHKQTQPRVSFILGPELDKEAKSLGHHLMSSARTDHYSVGKLSDEKVRERGYLQRGKEKKYHQSRSRKYQLHSCLLYFNYKQANPSLSKFGMCFVSEKTILESARVGEKRHQVLRARFKRGSVPHWVSHRDVCWAEGTDGHDSAVRTSAPPDWLRELGEKLLLPRSAGIFPENIKIPS